MKSIVDSYKSHDFPLFKSLVLDFDPLTFESLELTGSSIRYVKDQIATFPLTGTSHEPKRLGGGSILFSGATSGLASTYLTNSSNLPALSGTFSQAGSNWAAWTMFVVAKLDSTASSEQGILYISETADLTPQIFLYATNTNFGIGLYNDNLNAATLGNIGPVDTRSHVFCLSADGAGNINVWLDGCKTVNNLADVTPKNCGTLALGAAANASLQWVDQMNGTISRVVVFDRTLNDSERVSVEETLEVAYLR